MGTPWDCPKTQYGTSSCNLNSDCGDVQKAMVVTCTNMGATGRRVFEHARVCVRKLSGILPRLLLAASALVLITIPFTAAIAGEGLPQKLTGTVFIKGDVNDVTWDDAGIAHWEAKGNVYLKFTSTEGEIAELYGDGLLYEKRDFSGAPSHWVSVKGNAKLIYSGNTINAGSMEGFLEPLKLDVASGVVLHSEQLDISSEALSFSSINTQGKNTPDYFVHFPANAKGTFQRTFVEANPVPETAAPFGLPLPIDFRPDFKLLNFEADAGEIQFDDNGLVSASFPSGGKVETDTGYIFTGDKLSFDGWVQIDASGCRITGQDVEITCREMAFLPGEKKLDLKGDVSLGSNEGTVYMDSLGICYDDNGVSVLSARGNVRIDFTLTLGEDNSVGSTATENKVDENKADVNKQLENKPE